ELELEHFEPGERPVATLRVSCSSGTYVRTIADDLGRALGGVAHLGTPRRLRVGAFGVDEAVPLDAVEAGPPAALLPPVEAVRALVRADVGADVAAAVAHGAVLAPAQLLPAAAATAGDVADPGPVAVVGPDGT